MPATDAANLLLTLAATPANLPIEKVRIGAALLLGIAVFTVVFGTLWLLAARRRARGGVGVKARRRAKPASAWAESARRLRLPPDDGLADDDTRDIDPSDISPGDVDLRPDDEDREPPGPGRPGKGRR